MDQREFQIKTKEIIATDVIFKKLSLFDGAPVKLLNLTKDRYNNNPKIRKAIERCIANLYWLTLTLSFRPL